MPDNAKPTKSTVNILEAYALADAVTPLVAGKDLALVGIAFGMIMGQAARRLPPYEVIVLQNHVCKYIADFAAPQ